MDNNDIKIIEGIIGYVFNNKDLLVQAFVRKSYSQEQGGENNEVLEFIGDKALDYSIVRLLIDKYSYITDGDYEELHSDLSEGKLTNIKKKLVEKKTLAHRIELLNLERYLIMGKGDIKENIQEDDSVKEDLFEAIIGAVAIDSNWDNKKIDDAVDSLLQPFNYINNIDEDDNYIDLIQWL